MSMTIEHRLPTPDEYLSLRKSVGWPLFPIGTVEKGLEGSLFGVVIISNGDIIGMGRIVGDNAIYFHIQDVVIHPDFQRSGVGKLLMTELMKYIDSHAGANANVGLMCSKGREKFYERFGFIVRPNEKHGAGMIQVM
jgi:ribosomal protein S18 acetylase RimI-like enzyme